MSQESGGGGYVPPLPPWVPADQGDRNASPEGGGDYAAQPDWEAINAAQAAQQAQQMAQEQQRQAAAWQAQQAAQQQAAQEQAAREQAFQVQQRQQQTAQLQAQELAQQQQADAEMRAYQQSLQRASGGNLEEGNVAGDTAPYTGATWGDVWNQLANSGNNFGGTFMDALGNSLSDQPRPGGPYAWSQGYYSNHPAQDQTSFWGDGGSPWDQTNQAPNQQGLTTGGARWGVGTNTGSFSGMPRVPADQLDNQLQNFYFSGVAPHENVATRGDERTGDNALIAHYRDQYTQLKTGEANGSIAADVADPLAQDILAKLANLSGQVNNTQYGREVFDPKTGKLTADPRDVVANALGTSHDQADVKSMLATGRAVAPPPPPPPGTSGLTADQLAALLAGSGSRSGTGTGISNADQLALDKQKIIDDNIVAMRNAWLTYSNAHYYGSQAGIGFAGPQGAGQFQRLPEPPMVHDYYAQHPELGPDPFNQASPFTGYTGSTFMNPQHSFGQSQTVGNTEDFAPPPVVGDTAAQAGAGAGGAAHAASAASATSGYNQTANGLPHVPWGAELTGESGFGSTITPDGTPVPLSPWQRSNLDVTSQARIGSYQSDIAGFNPADMLSTESQQAPQTLKAPTNFASPPTF